MKDAMVVSWIKLSNMLNKVELQLKTNIHTLLKTEAANHHHQYSKLLDSMISKLAQILNYKLLVPNNQSQLPSMPKAGNSTPVVSSLIALIH